MNRRILGLFMVMTALAFAGCPNPAIPNPDQIINLSAIPGVTAPATGATPVTSITETVQYTGTVSWAPGDSTFAASTGYTATIALAPKAGYKLTGVSSDFFTVAGASATHAADSGLVTAVFPTTVVATITLLAIPGVTAPATGATPVTTAIDTVQYTGTIIWSPSTSTFAASTVYTANLVLTAKAGYTLIGVAADSFLVAGATVTHVADSGTVAAVFLATGIADYSSATIGVLKLIPTGSFQRNATATNISVITQPYRMSAYEITRAQFAALIVTDPSDTTYSSGMTDPVQMTNWYHAIAFCNKLSIAEGLTPVYEVTGINFATLTYASIPTDSNAGWNVVTAIWTNNGYRLPTEMEWMWAAMGATSGYGYVGPTYLTGYSKAFAGSTGSNAIGDFAVFGYVGGETGSTTTARSNPVGSKTTGANELGLYDMSGNVWEWCWDWYGSYPTGIVLSDSAAGRGAASGTTRVRRSSSWITDAVNCTVAERNSNNPLFQFRYNGFRVVRP